MGELPRKAITALLLLTALGACQPTPPATSLPPIQPTASSPSQPAPTDLPVPTPPSETELPSLPEPGDLSPTLSATATPQGISQEMDALIPPIPPAQLGATRHADRVLLSWLGTGLDIDTHYVIYRRTLDGSAWEALGFVAVQGDNRGMYSYLDTSPDEGQNYEYSVTTVNRYGKESDRAIILVEPTP